MTNLLSRLERLEREQPEKRTRIIWLDQDETPAQALSHAVPLEPAESPVFVSWTFGAGVNAADQQR